MVENCIPGDKKKKDITQPTSPTKIIIFFHKKIL